MNKFKLLWKLNRPSLEEYLLKSSPDKLTPKELVHLQEVIAYLQAKRKDATYIISYLQRWNDKLADRYKAKRAFETEMKRTDTDDTIMGAMSIGDDRFKCILSPSACPVCVAKTQNGTRIFTSASLLKSGYGHRPPFHPNCYCILIPH
jgi:hypothetical protein